jgi:hypothetical protein
LPRSLAFFLNQALLAQHAVDRRRQHLEVAPVAVLDEVIERAAPDRFGRHRRVVGAGQHHDGHALGAAAAEALEEFKAGQVRQLVVEQDAIWTLLLCNAQAFLARFRLEQGEGMAGVGVERALAGHPVDHVVLDQQDADRRRRRRGRLRGGHQVRVRHGISLMVQYRSIERIISTNAR